MPIDAQLLKRRFRNKDDFDGLVSKIEVLDELPNGDQLVKVLSEMLENCRGVQETVKDLIDVYLHEGVQGTLTQYVDLEGGAKIAEAIARTAYRRRELSSHDGYSGFGEQVAKVFSKGSVFNFVKWAQDQEGVELIVRAMAFKAYDSMHYIAGGGDGYWEHTPGKIRYWADKLKEKGLVAAKEVNDQYPFYAHCGSTGP